MLFLKGREWKNERRKILPKRRNFFFLKNVRRRIVKQIFFNHFLSIRRATTRRVNIKIRHEGDSKLSRNSKVKNKESHFFCKNALLERKRIEKMRKGRSSRKEKLFLADFLEKICEGESLNTRIYFYNILAKKRRIEICFVFEKSKKESKEERFPL